MSYCPKCGTENPSTAAFCVKCGHNLTMVPATGTSSSNTYVQNKVVVIGGQKSAGVAFLLAFLFGPLGLLYASVTGGLIMLVLSFISIIFFPLAILCWIICMIWAVIAVNNHNSNMTNKANAAINS